MQDNNILSFVPTSKLSEMYHTLYDLQDKLELFDEHLLNTTRCSQNDEIQREKLSQLLDASRLARDNLIAWYLRQTCVELNVTITLLTAKIKFIEYKLGACEGLDLHQACSLSLIDFCNILSDMTVVNVSPKERKTMKHVSAEAGIPVWLSHYRNQICHVTSESPCIAILVPLVAKSLDYLKQSFWLKVLEHESFDERKFKKYMNYIAKLTYVTYLNKRLHLKKGINLSKKKTETATKNLVKYSKICLALRRMIIQNSNMSIDLLARFITTTKFKDQSRNTALLLEQIIFAKQFEKFVFKLVALVQEEPQNKSRLSWLKQIVLLISRRKKADLKETLQQMELSASPQIKRYTKVPSIKCCQLAYILSQMDLKQAKKLIILMRHNLLPLLGKEKTVLLIRMTKLVNGIKSN